MKEFVKKIYYFVYIYSFYGLLTLSAALYMIFSIGKEIYLLYDNLEKAQQGIDITSFYPTSVLDVFLSTIALGFILYVLLFSLLVFFYREHLRKKIKQADFDYKDKSLTISFNSAGVCTGFFYGFARMYLKNITCAGKTLKFDLHPIAFLRENEFQFDLSNLPTSRYFLDHMIFHLKDPIGIFNARIYFKPLKQFRIISTRESYAYLALNKRNKFELSNTQSFSSKRPTEEFYNVRKYQWGDELKKINWKKTAKERKLMIKLPESKPESNQDLCILLNCFSPYVKTYPQEEIIGEFLDKTVEAVKSIIQNHEGKIDICINGMKETRLEGIDKFNLDNLGKYLIDKIIFGQKERYKQYANKVEENRFVVFSLSSDLVLGEKVLHKYIYFVGEKISLKNRLKKLLFFERENIFGSSFLENFEKINFLAHIKNTVHHYKYLYNYKKNEKIYKSESNITILNNEKI